MKVSGINVIDVITQQHKGNLKVHIGSKHEGVRYQCDQCDFTAAQIGHLKGHTRSKHEGFRF